MTTSSSKFESEAVNFAQQAVLFDQEGKTDAAVYFYTEAAASLIEALKSGSKVMGLKDKAAEYVGRAEELKRIRSQSNQMATLKSSQQLDSERAEFLLKHAFEEDENGNKDEAVDLYMEAAELCLQARKNIDDKNLMAKLAKLAEQALERAEQLKNIAPPINRSSSPRTILRSSSPHAVKTNPARTVPILGFNFLSQGTSTVPVQHVAPSPKKPQVSGSASYTKEEIDVLRLTSLINGREYVPFMSVDLKERFAYPVPFSDKDGKLTLAPKQKSNFLKWVRPEDFCSEPKIIDRIDCFSIKQTVVSDCSFVASLAISALYEKRFNKKLITRIIYPQNKNGEPVYNPCGKYMVKLHINGIPRKIIIDDYLPMGADGGLLCSFSTNRNELWISLLEKAYMKVMGGYDFPGSNSNIDLHALTGWIPERIGIRPGTPEFNKDGIFNKILERFHKGDVLLTMATGEISEGEGNRAGLVPTHAYALLDVQEVKGKKLILLKNPWMHLRWKGNFSDRDEVNWTKDLMDALRYNPRSAQQIDNGVFWIDWDSVCHFFDVIYMNWNPGMFKYTYCIHQSWKAGMGPIKDVYNISDNPQFKLEVKATPGCAVWILLTRHITDKEDFAQNKEYITVLIYKTEGKKIYYPHDPPPYIDGIRINSPHYLAKIKFDSAGTFLYTLVVSQYEKMNTIYYTLRVFSTNEFLLSKIPNPYKFKEEVTSQWKGITAGGCANNPNTYRNNPTFQINLDNSLPDNSLLIDLKGPKQYQVGFDVVMVTQKCSDVPGFSRKSSGIFRSGFCVLALDNVPGGTYNVIPSTFHPGQESPFFLTIQTSCQFKVSRLQ